LKICIFGNAAHFLVPRLGPETKFLYSSQKAADEYREAEQVELCTCPIILLIPYGPTVAIVIAVIVFDLG
jgi:hypothetical protein